jgi:Sulfotransferase family
MARHFVTWFLATLVLAHVCAQMQQTSSLQAAPHGWLSSLFLLGAARTRRKQSASSYRSSTLRLGPCAINGTLYPTPLLPQLLIVGAQKSGTTAVASILAHHEQMRGPMHKSTSGDRAVVTEGHFFDFQYRSLVAQSSHLADRDEQTCWLRNRYAAQYRRSLSSNGMAHAAHQRNVKEGGGDTAPIVVHLEKSPSYLISPHVPEAVHRLVPNAHVLVLLRNPVHRLLSHYRMMMSKQQKKKRTQAEAFDAGNSTGRLLKLDHVASKINGNLRRRQRPYQEEESALDDFEGILNQELMLLRHPVRTYLSSVTASPPRQRQQQSNFTIPPSPDVGSGAAYDAHYRWDDLARTPSSYRGYDRLLQRGMYSVQLERWMFALEGTGNNDVNDKSGAASFVDGRPKSGGRQSRRPAKLVVIPYELFESHPQAVFDYLWRRLKVRAWTVPSSILHARYSTAATASNSSDAMTHHPADAVTPHIMNFLYRFYRPYNDRLADLLGEEWRGIWDMPVAVTTKQKGAAAGADADDAAEAALGDDDGGENSGEKGEEDADDDDAIDSDPHAWKRVWLDKILRQ